MRIEENTPKALTGRDRRLWYEWQQLKQGLDGRSDIGYRVLKTNTRGLPTCYIIDYHVRSLCGVTNIEHLNESGETNAPLFADHFQMLIELPDDYPQVDAPPTFLFLTKDTQGSPIPHPWHPNIRFFGDFAGRVCLNATDTYSELVWGVKRVASYLRYEIYHAIQEPPYPEDLKVAQWVIRQGEPNEWIKFC